MQRITVINIKGGCGKTTVATNLAAAYAQRNLNTALLDFDQQGSSLFWLNQRSEDMPAINGIAACPNNKAMTRSFQLSLPLDTERAIIDTPAGLKGLHLIDQLKGTNVVIIPVLPSTIDTHATADFIRDLFLIAKVNPKRTRIGIISNRVKSNTLAGKLLKRFLDVMNIPVIAELRDTQNYVKAAEHGLGVHELNSRTNQADIEDWRKVIDWLENTESVIQPAGSSSTAANQNIHTINNWQDALQAHREKRKTR